MSHKLKALGLTLVAIFALSAVVASAASAAAKFEVEGGGEAKITGTQIPGKVTGVAIEKHEFTTQAGTVKCSLAEFNTRSTAPLKKESTELTLNATYGSAATPCTLAGTKVEVKMNECDYLFTAKETIEKNENNISVETHVLCPTGKVIEIQALGTKCVITVPAQTLPASAISVENTLTATPKMDVDAVIDAKELQYEVHDPETVKQCPNGNKITDTSLIKDGTYKGVATLQGTTVSGGAAVGVTVT